MGVTSSRGTFDVNRNANACPIMLPGRTVKPFICSRVAAYNTARHSTSPAVLAARCRYAYSNPGMAAPQGRERHWPISF